MAKKTKRPSARARGSGGRPQPKRPPVQRQPSGLSYEAAGQVAFEEESPEAIEEAIPDDSARGAVADHEPAAPAARPVASQRRGVSRVQPGTRAATRRPLRSGSQAAIFEPLPPDDAAIPFDRVPYVPADLRRVGVMALVMVALIIVAAIVVSVAVK